MAKARWKINACTASCQLTSSRYTPSSIDGVPPAAWPISSMGSASSDKAMSTPIRAMAVCVQRPSRFLNARTRALEPSNSPMASSCTPTICATESPSWSAALSNWITIHSANRMPTRGGA